VLASVKALSQRDPMYAVGEVRVLGVPMRGYVNAPNDLRFLIKAAAALGERTGVVADERRWSFADLAEAANAVAAGLVSRHGLAPGDRVALALRNTPEWMAAFLGVTAAGGVIVPLNGWWTAAEMARAMADCAPRLAIAGPRQALRLRPSAERLGAPLIGAGEGIEGAADTLSAIMAEGRGRPAPDVAIEHDGDAAIYYTSGSTGSPKGAALTHRGMVSAILSFAHLRKAIIDARDGVDPAGPTPAVLLAVPLFHVTGSHSAFMASILMRQKMVLMSKWDADAAIDLIEREGITRVIGVPTMSFELAVRAEARGTSLDCLVDIGAGGAKRPPAHVERLNRTFPQAWTSSGYGLTETNAVGAYNGLIDYQEKPASNGMPVPAVTDIKVVRRDGVDAATGEVGEVWIRGPVLFREYLGQPEATAAVLTPDRWFKTGDLGFIDEEGLLTLVGRLKEMLLRGGENVACLEVEAALAEHEDILEAAVIGIPDERLGERVGAAIVLRAGAQLDDAAICAFLEPRLAAFKRPERYWRMSEALPRSGTGKLDRIGLKRMLLTTEESADG
jgi:acyl-CoA synthetase (AMP-forming)/AMP-acid ligase II